MRKKVPLRDLSLSLASQNAIGENDSAHFNLSYFRLYGVKIPENHLKYTINNNNQRLSQKFDAGKGFINVFFNRNDTRARLRARTYEARIAYVQGHSESARARAALLNPSLQFRS